MLTKNEHFIKLQKKIAKKIEEKLGIPVNKRISSGLTLQYDIEVEAIHKITVKVATKYCEKHGLETPEVSNVGVKVCGSYLAGFVKGGSNYAIFSW